MSDEKLTVSLSTSISKRNAKKLTEIASKNKEFSVSRLIAIALDNELMKEKPFDIDLVIPEVDWEDHAYADQGGKILQFLKNYGESIDLPMLYLLRNETKVPNKDELLCGLAELLKAEFVDIKMKKPSRFSTEERAMIVLKGHLTGPRKKRYEKYLKLQKEFDGFKPKEVK